MPATETTWRNIKTVNVVFGVSSLLMLAATIWMMADDHNRPWKRYQREFQNIETWTAQARIDEQQSDEYLREKRRLEDQLLAVRSRPLDDSRVGDFIKEAESVDADQAEIDDVEATREQMRSGQSGSESSQAIEDRDELLKEMRDVIARRRFRENNLTREVKEVRAELTKAGADYDIAVGKGASDEQLQRLKEEFDRVKTRLDGPPVANGSNGGANGRTNGRGTAQSGGGLVGELQRAELHREELERIYKDITAAEEAARKELADHDLKLEQLHLALVDRAPNFGKRILEMPILDAFGSPLKVDQIWLPQLTLNNNFRDVARFDRCNTCHLAMDKTQPGSATAPGYRPEHRVTLELATPTAAEAAATLARLEEQDNRGEDVTADDAPLDRANERLRALYGFMLAPEGLLDENDVTVSVVLPATPAAQAQLATADVIEEINGDEIRSTTDAVNQLFESRTEWGQPLRLTVRRGLPHPYSTHPRLDLFVGSMSPHPMGKFGCTICHQGQGSATSFEWASHTPNDLDTANGWKREYGWFNNHHWILPMYSKRFTESSCLKCHHQVTELASSPKRAEPPAPKLTKGYQLILDYGCYGCHEINGFDGPTKRVGPDLRNEPNYFAAAAQLLVDPGLKGLGDEAVALAEQVMSSPEDTAARHRLHELVATDVKQAEDVAKQRIKDPSKAEELPQPKLSAISHKLEGLLRDIEAPGDLRKAGPSLRFVAAKNSFEFLYDWIENPHRFRPSTKMPRFFGLHDHLSGDGLSVAKEFEPVEIRAISEYLLTASQKFEYAELADDAEGSAERGKKVFELRGCLACHSHADFPKGKATHGPDLSQIGAKLASNPNGKKWLYSWVRDPSQYHARTLMPNTFLEPIEDAQGNVTDPALDVTEYLLTSQQDWKPRQISREMSSAEFDSLYRLALSHLEEKFPTSRAEQFLTSGIPQSQAGEIKGDEAALLQGNGANGQWDRVAKITDYVGRRSISKYGCFGCHDIPGFEDAKPIGTGLADWGRKDPSRLAFENIMQYLSHGHGAHSAEPHADHEHSPGSSSPASKAEPQDNTADYAQSPPFAAPKLNRLEAEIEADHEYFVEKIQSHEREGFIWQKLNDPRSYDYMKTENKRYNERLRMPKFYFSQNRQENDEAVEAIMTFVLGLVGEPPVAQYIYNPPPEQKTLVAGRKLLDKYNCGGCHVLEMDRWEIEYRPGWADQVAEAADRKDQFTGPEPEFNDWAFLHPHFSPAEKTASLVADRRGRLTATLVGTPARDETDGSLKRWDDDGGPLTPDDPTVGNYDFTLYEPVLINGVVMGSWEGQNPNLRIQPSMLAKKHAGSSDTKVFPARGGDLARLLFPVVVADQKKINPNVSADGAWGWVPPPLIGEGRKVQTGWLHDFLLDPYPIRPAVVLRMPRFNLSSDEAETIANYFAAVDGATYPYEFRPRTRSSYLATVEEEHPNHMADALKIVTNRSFCVQCHALGDYSPENDPTARGPALDRVHERLRPEYLRGWVASPKRYLPYTGMPQNIKHNMPVDQSLYQGTSEQQLNGVVDLLMNFDRFTQGRFSVRSIIPPAPATPAAPAGGNNPSAVPRTSSE
jgi:cytochrome c2